MIPQIEDREINVLEWNKNNAFMEKYFKVISVV